MQKIKNIFHLLRAWIATIYFGHPSRKLTVIGITGTDGKTTTSIYTHAILSKAGINVGLLSTISAQFGDKQMDTGFHVTSPGAWDVQKILRSMVNEGMTHVVLEVTSHAIDQNRFAGVHFNVTGLTNITHEHLDYHKSFEAYQKTKLSFLATGDISLSAENISDGVLQGIDVNLLGSYNTQNAKLAAAIALALQVPQEFVKKGIESVTAISGRMEVVYNDKFKVIVDFAHTSKGLYTALTSVRTMVSTESKVIVVFGCAGERDYQKRPTMGEIAVKNADLTVITAEDPRTEDVNVICQQIALGAGNAGGVRDETYFIKPNRKEAIAFALSQATEGSIVLITGKGHEKSMNLDGKTEIPWSDQAVVRELINQYTT